MLQIGGNAYSVNKTGIGIRTLYFNHKIWKWICTSTLQPNITCLSPNNPNILRIDYQWKAFQIIDPNSGSINFTTYYSICGEAGASSDCGSNDGSFSLLTATCSGLISERNIVF